MVNSDSPGDDGFAYTCSEVLEESWWTSERVALLNWLGVHAPALAPLYQGALLLAMRESFPGRVHFLAHAIREIRNRLPGALGPKVKQRKAGYEDLTDKIVTQWDKEGLPADGHLPLPEGSVPPASGSERREVSSNLLVSVGRLIKDHNAAKTNRSDRERSGFSDLTEHNESQQHVVQNWNKLFRNAHQFAHVGERDEPLPKEVDAEWVENFVSFEQHLFAVQRHSYANLDELDKLLQKANKR